jgi:hypothetical protein
MGITPPKKDVNPDWMRGRKGYLGNDGNLDEKRL